MALAAPVPPVTQLTLVAPVTPGTPGTPVTPAELVTPPRLTIFTDDFDWRPHQEDLQQLPLQWETLVSSCWSGWVNPSHPKDHPVMSTS